MKRKLRPILSYLALAMTVLVGSWLAVPRDICLTKLMLDGSCVCLSQPAEDLGCSCCTSAMSSNDDEGEGSSSKSTSGCFSISSQEARLIGPERTLDLHLVNNTFAVTSLAELAGIAVLKVVAQVDASIWPASDNKTYRNNCVFLI